MKTIRWLIGGAALVGVALTALLATADTGDGIVRVHTVARQLTPGEIAQVGAWIVDTFPGAPIGQIQRFQCDRRVDTDCAAYRFNTLSAAQYVAAEALDDDSPDSLRRHALPHEIDVDGSDASVEQLIGKRTLTPSQVQSLAATVAAVWGVDPAHVYSMTILRRGNAITGRISYADTLSPVARLLCLREKRGRCRELVGVVE